MMKASRGLDAADLRDFLPWLIPVLRKGQHWQGMATQESDEHLATRSAVVQGKKGTMGWLCGSPAFTAD